MKKIKWGVLGTAGIAMRQTIPGMLLAENCELIAIAGRGKEKAEEFQSMFGIPKCYIGKEGDLTAGYREMLADPEVEAVYIPLSNELHKEWTLKAIQAGKHVLCEKPLAPSAEECAEMIAAAEEKGVLLMEAFAYLHSPIFKSMQQAVKDGTLGELRYMEAAFITSDYDDSDFRIYKDRFGGSTYDLGCYNVSMFLALMDAEPDRVQAIATFNDKRIDNCTCAILEFGDVKATLTCGMALAREPFHRIERTQIHGMKASIVTDVQYNQCGELAYTVVADDESETRTFQVPNNYALEVEQFGRCLSEQEELIVTHEFTMRNARTLDRILKAIQYY